MQTACKENISKENISLAQTAASDAARLVETCKLSFATLSEAVSCADFTAAMFKDPCRVRMGFLELFINAVEHGCLDIGHELKSRLIASGGWETEISRRERLPENKGKKVDVVISRKADGIYAIVSDPGKGFDWKSWISLDPARADNSNGRGIARARALSFEKLTYNETGNQVIAYSQDLPELRW